MADRDYQIRMFNDIRRAIEDGHRRILCVLPTGGGKGYKAARIMQMGAEKNSRSLFMAASRQLIHQLASQLDRMGVPSCIEMAGVKNEYQDADEWERAELCTIASRGTFFSRGVKRKTMMLPPADIVHIDEAHESLSPTYLEILKHYEDSVVLGWTATPCRTDGRPLNEYYEHMVIGPTYAELQAGGHLLPCRVIAPSRPDLKGLKLYRGEFSAKGLEQRMNRNDLIGDMIAEWKRHSEGRSTVVFAAGVNHSIHVRNEFRKAGITCEHVDGKTESSEQEDIFGRARDNLISVVTGYGVHTTGVDVPRWKYMICLRPTKSFLLWRQMGGRVQRPFGSHDHCMIQDHSDNSTVFGYPDEDVAWTLEGDEKAENLPRTERNKPPHTKKDPFRCKNRLASGKICGQEYRGPSCPSCGFKQELSPEEIKMKEGQLKELERKKLNRETSATDKQKFWEECRGICIRKGWAIGRAAHMYKKRFGVFPTSAAGIQGLPYGDQWRMNAKEFYNVVIKPAKQAEHDSEVTLW